VAFVVDASLALTLLFGEEATTATRAALRRLDKEMGVVPGLWSIEVVNTIGIAERKGRITAGESEKFLARWAGLNLDVDSQAPGRAFSHILPLCRTYRLTSYDAVYIELALRRGLPLATLDQAMNAAARMLGNDTLH
jgi:predicted nucleic acid-binding protein